KSLRAQIGILILATSLIQLANGFFGTFISLRVAIEDFGPTISGLVLSSYFAGLHTGRAALRRDHRTGWAHPRLCRPRRNGRRRDRGHAAAGGAALLVDPACGHRFWLLWSFHYHRELAQRQGRAS